MVQAIMMESRREPEASRPGDARAGSPGGGRDLRKRHNLLDLTDEGREWAFAGLAPHPCHQGREEEVRRLVKDGYGPVKVPGIARREESPDARPDLVPVGFVSPRTDRGSRVRVAAFVLERHVTRATTPYEVLRRPFSPRNACLTALVQARAAARRVDAELGVWGSAGLELYTGLPFTHGGSDLDLLVKPAPEPRLRELLSLLQALEKDLGLRIDVELDLPNGYGVQLKELAMNVNSVLGKGSTDVTLLSRSEVWLLCDPFQSP